MDIRISGPHIADEAFDDEIMILDLTSGNYYSLEGAGADVWRGIRGSKDRDSLLADLLDRFSAEPGVIENALEAFLAELEAERLVARSPSEGRDASRASRPGRGPAPFKAPELQKYTDMQSLLLIDPIHSTDERGWPHADAKAYPQGLHAPAEGSSEHGSGGGPESPGS